MVFKSICLILLLSVSICGFANENTSTEQCSISGTVKDESNGEVLIGASVYVRELKVGVNSNTYGFYSISIPKGKYTVDFSYTGYQTETKVLDFSESTRLDIELKPSTNEIQEVVVTSKRKDENISSNVMGVNQLPIATIKKVPALMGEVDLLKVVQMLPGVVSAGEGTSSFSVRGGGIDQNLIILDEATVYNASHLLGFFSVFNNDAIKNMTLYKGDIPASYDGRLSSLLEVQMKDGNSKRFEGSGGLGLISSRLTLEGPIGKHENTSFIVSGRRTYIDLFLKLSPDKDINNNTLYFYDLNAKFNHRFDNNNHIFVSGYLGSDVFKNTNAGFSFGNSTFTFRWNHLFSQKLFSNFSLNYSNYNYNLRSTPDNGTGINWKYFMKDISFRGDFSWYIAPENTLKFGYNSTLHNLKPGNVSFTSATTDYEDYNLPDINAFEHAVYVSDEWKVNDRLSAKAGLRLTGFSSIGKGTVYSFDENYEAIDSAVYKTGEIIKTFYRLSPRLGLNYRLNEISSLKASYARTYQFLQMASNSTAGTPLDLWFTAGKNVEPQSCDQISLGYFRNFAGNKIEGSVEAFYKKMDNTIDFKDHADLILNPKLEGELRFGNSKAYGAEFLLRKNEGKLTGWISYTYSHTERTIVGVNDDQAYLAPYDRPHTVYIVGNYDVSRRISFGANFVYSTGQPITYPVARMEVGNIIVPVYSKRNEYRMPDYHRMDVSLTLHPRSKEKSFWNGEWNFSIYNVYAHKNAWAINFVNDPDNAYTTKAEMTYLFTFIPSITYNFKF